MRLVAESQNHAARCGGSWQRSLMNQVAAWKKTVALTSDMEVVAVD